MKSRAALAFLFFVPLSCLGTALAAAHVRGGVDGLEVSDAPSTAVSWTIQGPNSVVHEAAISAAIPAKGLEDGVYQFEIRGVLASSAITRSQAKARLDNGRGPGAAPTLEPVGVIETGHFRISGGHVVVDDVKEPPPQSVLK
ncbi:MAG: hypothetical protein KDG50_12475 [Chromatiales bacterium]|nr:hypothetical protein [Chromatiales bacterium]